MNKSTYELIDKVDDELSMLGMLQKMLTRRAFANYEKIGDECADINIVREEAAELWALSEQIYKQMKSVRAMLQSIIKNEALE